jgi:thiamine monophosphate kinase
MPAMKPTPIERALVEDLKVLLHQREDDIKPLCAALDTALDAYIDQAIEGDITRSDQEPIYRALYALTARLILLRSGAMPALEAVSS